MGLEAQSTLGWGRHFARKMSEKLTLYARILHDSCPKYYQNNRIFNEISIKINKILECIRLAKLKPVSRNHRNLDLVETRLSHYHAHLIALEQ